MKSMIIVNSMTAENQQEEVIEMSALLSDVASDCAPLDTFTWEEWYQRLWEYKVTVWNQRK